ncbi:hypothetical protein ACFW7J_24755 [Streptomyces sp. NPDC059525]|uniref:hypothetical protein n=1 Tax=Streptomyces sp. NPDC059525 TaxID=3346857 RepID=UPI0036BA9346
MAAEFFDSPWAHEHLSPSERTALTFDSWFETFQALAGVPAADLLDLARRLREGRARASAAADRPELDRYLAEHVDLVESVARLGAEAAAEEKLGTGGVLAGMARRKREEYYRTKDRRTQLEALDLFVNALLCGDDPSFFDHGKTMQGFASVTYDLGVDLGSSPLLHLTVMAQVASLTARFTSAPEELGDTWLHIIRCVVQGCAGVFDALHGLEGGAGLLEGFDSLEGAVRAFADLLGSRPAPELFWTHAHRMVMTGLLLSRVRPGLPVDPDDPLAEVIGVGQTLVYQYLKNWSSDALRLLILSPGLEAIVPDGEPLGPAPAATGTRRPAAVSASFLAGTEELRADPPPDATEEEVLLFRTAQYLDRLFLAVTHQELHPAECAELVESARSRLAPLTERLAGAPEGFGELVRSLLHLVDPAVDLGLLCDIAEGHTAAGGGRTAQVLAKLRPAILHPATGRLVDACLARVTAWLDGPATVETAPAGAVRISVLVFHGALVLDALSRNLGLQDVREHTGVMVERLLAARITEALPQHPEEDPAVSVDPGLPEEVAGQLRWILKFPLVHYEDRPVDRDRLLETLPAAYSAGLISLHAPWAQFQLANNLGVEYNAAGQPREALPWLVRAQALARESGSPEDLATAVVNVSLSLQLIGEALHRPWSMDIDGQSATLGLLFQCLGAVSEGLHALGGFETDLSARDRFSLHDHGFLELHERATWALVRLEDHALLAEYLMNIRSSWYYSELVDEAADGGQVVPSRTRITWRGRCWLARPGHPGQAGIEALDLLRSGDRVQGWLGTLFHEDSGTYCSSFLLSPQMFGSGFSTAGTPDDWSGRPPEELALVLGATLPEELWVTVVLLVEADLRGVLYVSADPATPPLNVGYWSSVQASGPVRVGDAFDVVYCPDLKGGHPPRPRDPAAGLYVVCDPLGDLPEARRVPEATVALCGNTGTGDAPAADRATVTGLLRRCAAANGIFLYQGHSDAGSPGSPGSASLRLEADPLSASVSDRLTVTELLTGLSRTDGGVRLPERMILMSCDSGTSTSVNDSTSLAAGALAGGATHVISALAPISEDSCRKEVVEMAVEVLNSPYPEKEFGRRQRELHSSSAYTPRQLRDMLSLTLFSTPIACGGPPDE